jgi:hypothetical protein
VVELLRAADDAPEVRHVLARADPDGVREEEEVLDAHLADARYVERVPLPARKAAASSA